KLARPELRQLNQRITTRVRLGHLGLEETRDYLNYRLIKAGKTFLRFDDSAVKHLFKLSGGIPRLINILALRSLMAAYIDETNIVSKCHVENAERSIKNSEGFERPERKRAALVLLAVFLVFFLTGAGLYYISQPEGKKPSLSPVAATKIQKDISRYALVKEDANIREAPGLESRRVGIVMKGQKLPIIGETTDGSGARWFKIRLFDDRAVWIAADLVNVLSEKGQKPSPQ
ncbi:MAG: hypothetical protein D6710_05080, partial [Nitrospirae bacterium]